ncbi:hypothetical protein BBJ28_00027040, partial [Nothophytophthora sp. Chile5]
MFRAFGAEAGTALSAMSFVLVMRELPSAKFQVNPAVLMAIFSGRLGSRGLTIMHFKEASEMTALEDGSTNANFASDFSPSASLPPATSRCSSYEDILDALHGLTALGEDVWYAHMLTMTSRLRMFVAKNKSADPANSPTRVRLTLLYVNKFIGAALGHLQADDPEWWCGFSEALCAIDYESPALSTAVKWHANARERSDLLRHIRRDTLAKAMSMRGIELPTDNYPVSRNGDAGPEFLLNEPLQHALSELARRTGASLPAFVELVRGQTPSDYRPNKNLVPEVLEKLGKDYEH